MSSSQFSVLSSRGISPQNRELRTENFTPSWWLRGAHAQTVWGRLTRPKRLVRFRREVLRTPDDDDLIVDHLDAPVADPRYRFVLVHGLEGSSYSVYMQGFLATIARLGFAASALNFRSCARDPQDVNRMLSNRRPRLYHSGETDDLNFLLRTFREREPEVGILLCGASLGGNVVLKWLGENPKQTSVAAAATLSVPFDLGAGAQYLERGAGPLYVASFLRTLKTKTRDVVARFPELATRVDVRAARAAKTFRQFDDAATGPLHDFNGADDYYNRASSIHFLGRIAVPSLCISSEDDPFLPREVLQRAKQVASGSVEFRITDCGGHTGFIAGPLPWRCQYWAEDLMVRWLVERASA